MYAYQHQTCEFYCLSGLSRRGGAPLFGDQGRRMAVRHVVMAPPKGFVLVDPLVVPVDHQLAQSQQLDGVEIVRDHRRDAGRIAEIEQEGLETAELRLDLLA